MTPEQAYWIADANDIFRVMDDDEERELLESNNPELFDAYQALIAYAVRP
ncbi:MAG: hypothetical protein Q8N51_00635 [Gammaproteobacteria bacterium]|nr:hypothetical protein [Gammaproteobacteria bacterium]